MVNESDDGMGAAGLPRLGGQRRVGGQLGFDLLEVLGKLVEGRLELACVGSFTA